MFNYSATVIRQLILVATLAVLSAARCLAQTMANEIGGSAAFFNQVWQTEDGLPNNDVHGVAQDADGFLWVGTRHGLVRFDGVHFVPASAEPGINLAQISVWRMGVNNERQVIAAFEAGGIARQNHQVFESFKAAGEPYLQRAYNFCSDKSGALWVASLEGKVARLAGGAVKSLGAPGVGAAGPSMLATDRDGVVWLASKGTLGYFIGDEFVRVTDGLSFPLFIAPNRNGGIWLATAQSLCRVEKGQPLAEVSRLPWLAGDTNVRDLLEDRSGALWIGTSRKGLIRFSEGLFQTVPTSHNNILCLTEDRAGNLWVGTQGGGLNRVRLRQFKVIDTRRGLPNDSIFSFADDRYGRIWIATQDGGLCYWSNSVITVLGEAQGWRREPPLCLAADAQGGIWIGTQKSGLLHYAGGRFEHVTRDLGVKIDVLNCLLVDHSGRVWAGSMLEGLFCVEAGQLKTYTVKDGLPGNGVRAIIEDKQGVIWVGTDDGGLARFTSGTFQKFTHERWAGDAVRTLLPMEDDSLWIGTVGSGLVRFKGGHFSQINSTSGLPDDSIQALMLDEAGWLWCGASRGLFRVKLSDLNAAADGHITSVTTFSYGRSDGLSDFQFNGEFQPATCRTVVGKFWFASVKGAVVFSPDTMLPNREPPNIFIETVLQNGNPVNQINEAKLEPGVRHLEFRFVTPEFAAPERMRYRHKLDGSDVDWSPISASAVAIYTNVSPGHHRFRVIACNSDGIWNESGTGVAFSVAPFFWQTWWFAPAATGVVVLLIVGAVRWVALRRLQKRIANLEAEHALEKERGRIAQDIHDELGANLTSIGWLADLGFKHREQPGAVVLDLEKIANTARESLSAMDAIVWALNPRNDSSENFANYVAHFANEFLQPTGIRCRLDIPTDLPVRPMSTEARHHLFLAIKEALHNVVQHAKATEVWLRLADTGAELRISVVDNGCGLPTETSRPGADGLASIRKRLEALAGNLKVETQPGAGTGLHFSVPWARLNPR